MSLKVLNGLDLANQRIQNLTSPAAGTDAVNRDYVDNLVNGLTWKTAVRAATTANVTLASALENGDTLDGVTLATGDRILVKNQSTLADNGIYIVAASGTPARAEDANSTAELHNATVFVREGTINADTAWTQTATVTTVGTTAQTWVQFGAGGGSSYTFNGGVKEAAGVVSLDLDTNPGLVVAANKLKVLLDTNPGLVLGAGGLKTLLDTNPGLVLGAGGLKVLLNGASLTLGASGLSVTTPFSKYAATVGGSNPITVTHSLGTTDVKVEVFEVSSGATVLCDVTRTSTSQVRLDFGATPAASSLRVVVHA